MRGRRIQRRKLKHCIFFFFLYSIYAIYGDVLESMGGSRMYEQPLPDERTGLIKSFEKQCKRKNESLREIQCSYGILCLVASYPLFSTPARDRG